MVEWFKNINKQKFYNRRLQEQEQEFMDNLPEQKLVSNVAINTNLPIFPKMSNLIKLQRIIAYVLRFEHNSKSKERISGCIKPEAMKISLAVITKT